MAARPRILLVEDDPNLAELVRNHLEREDFEVETTPEGEEALLLARETPPALVVLDWMLERLSGVEVCRRRRRLPGARNSVVYGKSVSGRVDRGGRRILHNKTP